MANTFTSMIDLVYPVNSVYLSWSSDFKPASSFGGTWTKLEDGKMLRSGTGHGTGGNDKHSHLYGALMKGYYGVASSSYSYDDDYISLVNPIGVGSDNNIFQKNVWSNDKVVGVQTNNAVVTKVWKSPSATGYAADRVLAMVGKNVQYKPITTQRPTTVPEKLSDANLLKHGTDIETSNAVCIPAYQTINTWYRTA